MGDTKIWMVADRRIPEIQVQLSLVDGEPYPTYRNYIAAKRACYPTERVWEVTINTKDVTDNV